MTSKKSKIWEKNLYDILETTISATESDIKKAYRKKALKCHPDKNPNDPKAAELFLELSSALEILTDAKARAAYDRTLKAKELAKARTNELDSKRRKLKDDLERREKEAKESAEARRTHRAAPFETTTTVGDEEVLKKEIERLKKEGSRALREEQELIKQQILKEQQDKISLLHVVDETERLRPKFKVKWSSSVAIDEAKLKNVFEKYGKVSNLIVIKRTALVEFLSGDEARAAFEAESQKSEYQWNFEWVSKPTVDEVKVKNSQLPFPMQPKPQNLEQMSSTGFEDFEAMILGKLTAAAQAQKVPNNS